MIKCTLAICADRVLTDQVTKNVSIIHVIDVLSATAFPIFLGRLTCLFLFSRELDDPGRVECAVTLSLANEELMRGEFGLNFQEGILHRQTITIEGLVINGPGTLTASAIVEGKELGAWRIPVLKVGKPQLQLDLQESARGLTPKGGRKPRRRRAREADVTSRPAV
jgi:hypothetical protein